MKTSYIVRAKKFLNVIFPYIYSCYRNVDAICRVIHNYNIEHQRNIIVRHGAARIVLITSDYVIKWDYNRRNVELFGGCIEEAKMYSFACDEGYEYLLAECTSVEKEGMIFNIMPRYNMREDEYKPYFEELLNDDECEWLEEYIGDLHDNNYTVVDGTIIIIDYACPK